MDLIITILPVVTKDLPISPRFTPYSFFIAMQVQHSFTTRQPMVEFYLLTFPRFPLRKKEHKSYFGKNQTYDFRTSRCADYLLDHSGDHTAQTEKRSSCTLEALKAKQLSMVVRPLVPTVSTFNYRSIIVLRCATGHERVRLQSQSRSSRCILLFAYIQRSCTTCVVLFRTHLSGEGRPCPPRQMPSFARIVSPNCAQPILWPVY